MKGSVGENRTDELGGIDLPVSVPMRMMVPVALHARLVSGAPNCNVDLTL